MDVQIIQSECHLITNIYMCVYLLSTFSFSSVQFSCSVLSNSLWPHESQHTSPPCPSPLPESTQTHVHWVGDPSSHLILCHPLLLLPPILPSIRVFSKESTFHMRWPKYWSFSFNISPSNEPPGLISFRMDWLDLLAVQGILKSLLQQHSSKASILQRLAFFTIPLSHPYMTTWKTIALTRQTFDGKVMSLLFNMLSRLIITFLPRSKHLLISWLQSPSAVVLETKKIKSDTVSTVYHLFPMKWWDQIPWSKFFECWALRQLFHRVTIYSLDALLFLFGTSLSFYVQF